MATQSQPVPIENTPLPGAMMPLAKENRMVPPQSDKKAHHKPGMIEQGDKNHTVPI